MPTWRTLSEIGQAPHDAQVAAFKRFDHGTVVAWNSIAAECIQRRIPRERAIFDIEASNVVFEEDLFAEPGTRDQWTTTDIAGFMRAQEGAIVDRIEGAGEPAVLVDYDARMSLPKIPAGWEFADFGADRTLTKRSRHKRLYAIIPASDYHDAGKVVSVIIKPIAAKGTKADESDTPEPEGDEDDPFYDPRANSAGPDESDESAEVNDLTHAGYDMLNTIRHAALVNRLRSAEPVWPIHFVMALVIQIVAGDYQCRDLLAAMIDPSGCPRKLDMFEIERIGREALARKVEMKPKHRQNSTWQTEDSFNRAEWIGLLFDADASMPRLDTPEVLAHVTGVGLRRIAEDFAKTDAKNDKPPKKVADLRAWLAGRAEHWLPMHFGAPAPIVEPWQPGTNPDDFDLNDKEQAA